MDQRRSLSVVILCEMTDTCYCCLANLLEVCLVCISVYLGVGEEKVVISVHECCAELPACIQTCI